MIIEEADYLKQWLINKLQEISEADPSVLAKYVIALLKKDDSFQQETFVEQLEVFLEDATVPFVRSLFNVIESKEYFPKKKRVFSEQPEEVEVERAPVERKIEHKVHSSTEQRLVEMANHPLEDDKMNARKRRFEEERRYDDDRKVQHKRSRLPREDNVIKHDIVSRHEVPEIRRYEERRYPKPYDSDRRDDHRLSDRYTERRQPIHERVGYPKREARRRSPSPRRSASPPRRSRSRSPIQRKSDSPNRSVKPSRKERCRDFDEKGYCLRGGLCPYDHGMDPVVVEESNLSNVLQAATNPSNNYVTPTPPPIYPPVETYNPDHPAMPSVIPNLPALPLPPPPPVSTAPMKIEDNRTFPETHNKRIPLLITASRSFKLVDCTDIITGNTVMVSPGQTTLLIRDVPGHHNNSHNLATSLGKYGPIKILQCQVYNDKSTAVVDYHNHQSAVDCFNGSEAIIGNRYIKVFWKEVIPISQAPAVFNNHGQKIHQSMNLVNASNPPITPKSVPAPKPLITSPTTNYPKPAQSALQMKSELKKKQQSLLDQNVTQQKLILKKLLASNNSVEKKSLMQKMKILEDSHKTIKSMLMGNTAPVEKRRPAAPKTMLGANTNLDLRPREIFVKNCTNAEDLAVHFKQFGPCNVVPSGVGVIIGFDTRKAAEMAYVKGRMVDNQELDLEWNKPDTAVPTQVAVEPIR